MSENNDLGLTPDSGATATMNVPHNDLGLVSDTPQSNVKPPISSQNQEQAPSPTHDQDLGLQHDLNPEQYKKDVNDLGIVSEHGDVFSGPKEEWYSPAVRAVEGAADAFTGHFSKASPLGIGERIANPAQEVLTPKQQAESQENPAAAFLGEASGSAATFGAAAAIPEVSLPIAFGAASALSGVADQADTIKDANNQLTLGQRIGKVGVDAVAGGITGKIFDTASKGATILDRVIERSGGAGATAITQSLANQAVEGKDPDVGQAIAQGGLQAVTIGIVAGMAEVPHLRGLVMDQAKALVGKDGTVMGNTGPYKVDPENLTIDQAKKILTDATINPESLAPEFQQAQYDIKKQVAMENLGAKAKQYGVDEGLMADVLNAQGQRAREGILQDYLTKTIRIDPAKAEKLLPFFDAIKKGADPADIIIMSDMLQKFNTKTEVSENIGDKNANATTPENAASAGKTAVTPAGENEQGTKLPLSEGNEKAGLGDTSAAQAGAGAAAARGGSGQPVTARASLAKTPVQLSDDDHKDIKNLLDWESNMPNGEKWSFINSSGEREFGGTPSGHSEAMQTIGPKESMRLLQKASNGDNLTANQQAAVKHLLADYQSNIKPHLEAAQQEIENAHKELPESQAIETASSFKSEAPSAASAWEEHAQGQGIPTVQPDKDLGIQPDKNISENIGKYAKLKGDETNKEIPKNSGEAYGQIDKATGALRPAPFAVKFKKNGFLSFPKEKITSPADVAFAFRHLTSSGIEHFYIVATKAGQVVNSELITMGTYNQANPSTYEFLNLLDKTNADGAYFVHNHPSGNIDPSPQDLHFTLKSQEILKKIGVDFKGHVIIDTEKFSFIKPDGNVEKMTHQEYKDTKKVSVLKKHFEWASNKDKLGPQLKSAKDVYELMKGIQVSSDNSMLIAMSSQNKVMNMFVMPQKRMTEKKILMTMARARAGVFILVNSGMNENKYEAFEKLAENAGMNMLDSVDMKGDSMVSKVDGIIKESAADEYSNKKMNDQYLDSLKSERNTDNYKNDQSYADDIEKRIRQEEASGPKYRTESPVFYSQASKVIDEKMPNAATPEQIKGILSDKNGVKPDELKWMGLDDFLAGKTKVTKAELQDFVKQNQVQVQEVEKGGQISEKTKAIEDAFKQAGYSIEKEMGGEIHVVDEQGDSVEPEDLEKNNPRLYQMATEYEGMHGDTSERSADQTKFERYQLPGGKNYRELLLTLPQKEWKENTNAFQLATKRYGKKWEDLTEEQRTKLSQEVQDRGKRELQRVTSFQSGHFDEPNVLAHIRMNDRVDADGKKNLFIEEVQSDWHQKGKKEGYKADNHIDKEFQNGVPDAPFQKTWHELAMKRMLRYAAENGYDRLSWTTGAQQAERYDLSKQIKVLRVERESTGFRITATDNNDQRQNLGLVYPDKLAETVGKDLAEKIIKNNENTQVFTGLDLKVGGEGMKGFYDKMLPSFMNNYAKKWGGKVGETNIGASDKFRRTMELNSAIERNDNLGFNSIREAANAIATHDDFAKRWDIHGKDQEIMDQWRSDQKSTKVHSIDITPAMKESVMSGQPMFKRQQPSWDYLQKDKDEYVKANKEGLKLIEKYVPQLKDSLVNPAFIPTKDGTKAIGAYYKGRIYVKTGAGLNVYVHELGHAVFDLFLTPEEKGALLAEGLKIYGKNADVEERIMLDFEKYAKDNRFIPDNTVWGKIKSFFKNISDRLLKFIGINPVSIKSFYDAVLGGEFKDATPRKDYEAQGRLSGQGSAPVYKNEMSEFKGSDPAIAAVAKAYKEIISLLAPRMLVPRESLDMIMRMKGQRDKLEFVLENRLKQLEKTFDNMPKEEQVAFVDKIKTGESQPTEALQKVADMMRTIEDKYWQQAKDFKPTLAYKENHFRVMWKVIPGSPEARGFHGLFKRPFQGTQGWAKKSTLADMSEGIKAGGIPYSYNPVTMWRNSIMDMQKFITARRMWNNLKTMGMVKYVRAGEKVTDGMVLVDDRISHVYLPVEATPIGSENSFNANLEVGKYYIEEASGRIMNNFLGRDYIRESTLGGGLLAFKNLTTGIELSLSPFHAAYTTLMASSSNIGLGLQKIANRGLIMGDSKAFLEGLADIAHGIPGAGAARYFDLGTKAIKYVSQDEFVKSRAGQDFIKAFPEAHQLLDDLFTGGGKLAQSEDYKITALKAFTQGIRDFGDAKRSFMVAQANKDAKLMQKYAGEMAANAWAEVIHLLPSVNQMIMTPLFQIYIPRLKIGAFLSEYSNDLIARQDQLESGRLTRAQLARDTWDSVERRFGEMNFDNIFWDRNFKTALQIAFRSVTWKIGALQNIGGAGTGTIKDLSIAVQDKALPKLNRNMAMILGLALMVTVFGEVLQLALTGKHLGQRDDGKEDLGLLLKDAMDPRYNKNGDRLFFNTHLKDWAHLFHSPGGFIANSTSGFIGRTIEDWNNKDFFNAQIHNPKDPAYKQAWDMLVHLIPLPFMITNQSQLKMKEAPDAVKAMTAMGFTTPAPGYVTQTPVYQLASKIMSEKPYAQVTKTKDQEAKYQMLSQLRQQYAQTKDPTQLQALERSGQITMKQYMNIKKEAGMSPLQRIASSHQMNFDDISQLMQKAIQTKSVDEQNTLWPILREKYFNTMEHTPFGAGNEDRRNDLKAVYDDIRTKLGK